MSEDSTKQSSVKQRAKSMFRKIVAIAVIIFLAVILFFYYANLSDGLRAGVIVKVSERGVIFKTYEGQLDVGTFGAVKGAQSGNQLNETFEFSVQKNDTEVYDALIAASRSGERVQIKYKQKYGVLFWRGDTPYFVYEVIPSGGGAEKKREFPPNN